MTPVATRRRRAPVAMPAPDPGGETTVTGRVGRVVFRNAENGWSVLSVHPDGQGCLDEPFAAVGHLGAVREGDTYCFTGSFRDHPRHGKQFAFSSAEVQVPRGRDGITSYLASTAHGVGPVKAGRIVDALGGEDTLDKLQADPNLLDALDFLTAAQRAEIRRHLAENQTLAELTALICRAAGVTPALACRIYGVYGPESVATVRENPYLLADDVWGVGFLTADKVARAVGVALDSPYRVEAAVRYILAEAAGEGHCYLEPKHILRRVMDLLEDAAANGVAVGVGEVARAAAKLVEQGHLVREGDAIYSAALWRHETALAARMRAFVAAEKAEVPDLAEAVGELERHLDLTFHPRQREAIRAALASPLSIVTGGPGTGKSLCIRAIADLYEQVHPGNAIHLASPTGRAAKRITELTAGREAKTVHRLLEYHPDVGFQRDEDNLLPAGLVVVDEFSMADLELAACLFAALDPELHQVVLVGDVDQLPSVGPGSVLRDAISSGVIPVTRLEFVYRGIAGSRIHEWGHEIRSGQIPPLVTGDEITVIACPDQEQILPAVLEEVVGAEASVGRMGYAVLSPMKKGPAGVKLLNEAIRAAVNGTGGREVWLGGTGYRSGDKVMVIRNNYALEVFNGDVGVVESVTPAAEPLGPCVWVRFPGGREVRFGLDEAGILSLAYASTVHKAQGSEYPVVVVALIRGHHVLLQRNLVYTAVTRAKRRLVVVHQPGAVEKAVRNNRIEERFSRLGERLKGEARADEDKQRERPETD